MDVILHFTRMNYMQICIMLGGICFSMYQLYVLFEALS